MATMVHEEHESGAGAQRLSMACFSRAVSCIIVQNPVGYHTQRSGSCLAALYSESNSNLKADASDMEG